MSWLVDTKKQLAIEKINQKLASKAKEVELARQMGELDIVKLSEIYYPDDELTKFLVKEKENRLAQQKQIKVNQN